MFSNLAYLLTSKSITLYILYTLHVMLGTSLVFTALYTYGLHSSKAMARAAALEASMQASGNSGCGISAIGNGSAVEFEDDIDSEVHGMDIAIGGLDGMRKVGSVVDLSTSRVGWENESVGLGFEGAELGMERTGVRFREICYSSRGKEGLQVDGSVSMMGGRGISVEIS
ncbi:d4175c7e-4a2c-4791-80d8-7a0854e05f32-CDS [Sclerotinia trifoliorum]|uniref:D4175c7e-4a2c-4791-80d8-7a0854e05f32-CDS n=1 Tax=Sclerotinia trifoliorum TaxID=28548 RepID=A0A8H2VXZ4_9HELO|nr:d4175c7e-4a2c-4791-80d8-7a0854e05f32-CDS [Sclerotinia trifoliorum]